MEAESYLTDGYGIRLALEAKPAGWVRFSEIAKASAPPRIKQVLVAPEHGVPYLNTSQVFDLRPRARKWLAMEKTTKAEERLVKQGTILVIASGSVGRATIALQAHENTVISHDFIRVYPKDAALAGWAYAYLRSPQAQAMTCGSQYGAIIQHLEPHHLANLPVPQVSKAVAADFQKRVAAIVASRNDAARLRNEAEAAFAKAVGSPLDSAPEYGFTVNLGALRTGRRRLEAAYHTPQVKAIVGRFKEWQPLGEMTSAVWWGKRFRRHYGDGGIPYMSADDLFTTNPHSSTKILVDPEDGHEAFFVERGWLLMACSGQTYGLNGATTIATEWHENIFFSHDLIRIRPKQGVRAGYLLTALTHPVLGRPLLIREAYGMSIPHLDPQDVAAFPVVRLGAATEDVIADLAERAASEQARAEVLERDLAQAAGSIISEFLMRPLSLQVVVDEDEHDSEVASQRLAEIAAQPETVVRGAELDALLAAWEA